MQPNELVRIQIRVGDIPTLLDALESRLEEFVDYEGCGDGQCYRCEMEHGALHRLRDTLLAGAPKVEVEDG